MNYKPMSYKPMSYKSMKHKLSKIMPLTLALLTISACSSNDSDNKKSAKPSNIAAVINTIDPGYTDSDIELFDLTKLDGENVLSEGNTFNAATTNYNNSLSDYSVDSYGEYYYRIGRGGIDTITKYSITNPQQAIYSYSTIDNAEAPASNPYQLIFLNEKKAYLIRYDSTKIWIVNPSATTEADFKIGEIDISHYDDGDGSAEVSSGIIVNGNLYITMQRLEIWNVIEGNSYVAVFDTTSDEEIIAGTGEALPGIQLKTDNPQTIVYQKDTGLFVQSIAGFGQAPYTSGIEKIDLHSYSTSIIIDDGDADNSPYGAISDVAIISHDVGYFVGYAGWQATSLYQFNPSTGAVNPDFVASIGAANTLDIRDITEGPENTLWISIADNSNPRVLVLNTTDNSSFAEISTLYNPTRVVFAATNTELDIE